MNDLIDDPRPGQNLPEYTVSEISGAVKRTLEGEFGRVRVKGEVGRVFNARSGHLYFDVKDDRSVLACTTWKGQIASLSVKPEEGLEVVVTGRMTAFGGQSKYNLNVDEVAIAGQGALMALLEKRKKQLAAEGLFDEARKRRLPYLPDVIGVVTSPSGAVIRDILHRLRDRFPRKVLIWPVAVQGAACAPEVARAIEGFNKLTPGGALPRPDLIIVARGGGSVEDLWGFNEEIVARAAAASEIPLISAVGHETDTTLIDYVSDRRAPTPTAAAELAVPVRLELAAWLEGQGARLTRAAGQAVALRRQRLGDLSRGLPKPEYLLEGARQRLDRATERLDSGLITAVRRKEVAFHRLAGRLSRASLDRFLAVERRRLTEKAAQLLPMLDRALARKRERLDGVRLRPALITRPIAEARASHDLRVRRFASLAQSRTQRLRDRLEATGRMLEGLGYERTLERGYVVVRAEGEPVTTKAAAEPHAALELQFADGRLTVAQGAARPRRKSDQEPPPDQGSLF